MLPTSGQPRRRIPVARGEKSDFESDEDGSIPSTGAMKKYPDTRTIVPEHLRQRIESNPELWEGVNRIIESLHDDMVEGVEKLGCTVDEVCALIMWDDVDMETTNPVTMAMFTSEHYEMVRDSMLEQGRDNSAFLKGLQDLMNEKAEGFIRVLVVTRSGSVIRLRAGTVLMSKGGQA